MNSKWITDLSRKAKSIQLLEESTWANFPDLGLGNDGVLDMTSKFQMTKI